MLSWFDEDPRRYWWLASLVLALVAALILRPLLAKDPTRDPPRSDWHWGWILVLLSAGRWPTFFVTRGLNPDESQLIAGAITLRHDPMFWRSVDGGTAGPFDFYALLPVGWLAGSDYYLSARLTALLLLAGTLLFVHQLVAREFGRVTARLATLGAITFEALTLHADFLHYSTELVPLFLLAAASLHLGWGHFRTGGLSTWGRAGLGALLGSVPLAKLQAAPLAAFVGLWLVVGELLARERSWSERGPRLRDLILGALVPVGFFAALLSVTGEWENAIVPYILHNLSYVAASTLTLRGLLAAMAEQLALPGTLYLAWAGGVAAAIVWVLAWGLAGRRPLHPLCRFAALFLLLSAVCVCWPRRPFPHYLQLSVIPGTLLLGAVLGSLGTVIPRPTRQALVLLGCFSFTLFPLVLARSSVRDPLGQLELYQSSPRGPVAHAILRHAKRGESLGVWGWSTHFYAETGLWQATRDAFSQAEILDHPYYDYFRRRYLGDFQRNLPPVFVDATAWARINFPTQPLAHDEIFPELGSIVREHYVRMPDVDGVRIYARKDRVPPPNP